VIHTVLEKRATCRQLAKNWACSFIGNLVGTFIIAYLAKTVRPRIRVQLLVSNVLVHPLLCPQSGVVGNVGNLVAIGKYKTSLGPYTAFTRGILCNWLVRAPRLGLMCWSLSFFLQKVCMAVYMSYGVSSATGKFIAIFLPISAFSGAPTLFIRLYKRSWTCAAMGFEHSVANMFTIPCSMLHGSGVGLFKYLLSNLLPVTLGNIVAGAHTCEVSCKCVGLTYKCIGAVAVAFGYSLPFGTHTRAQSTHS
jgi:formate/nitrite transporter FocA (FNT family)